MKIPKLFRSKIFFIFLALALIGAISLEYKLWWQRHLVNNEIEILQAEEARLLENNSKLQESIAFLSAPESQEKLARLQLNLKKEGEIVVQFPTAIINEQLIIQNPSIGDNPMKWWKYIF